MIIVQRVHRLAVFKFPDCRLLQLTHSFTAQGHLLGDLSPRQGRFLAQPPALYDYFLLGGGKPAYFAEQATVERGLLRLIARVGKGSARNRIKQCGARLVLESRRLE